ncbi:MAG: hypothetical protein AB7T27_03455 [Kiritimatiellia bacterium]
MRTTLTIADDVATVLERVRRTRRSSLRDTVNDALRRGLSDMERKPERKRPVRTRTVDLGRCLLDNIDDVSETLAIVEGEAFR